MRFIHNLASIWGTYGAMRELGQIAPCTEDPSVFDHVFKVYDSPTSMSYFSSRRVEVQQRGYTILEGVADPLNPTLLGNREVPFVRPATIPTETRHEFFSAVQASFDMEIALNPDDTSLWNAIFNYGDDAKDAADRANNVARFSSTPQFKPHSTWKKR